MYGTILIHHGILGQKWGVRRYQNPDGTLTEEGRARYSDQTPFTYTLGKGLFKRTIRSTEGKRKFDLDYRNEMSEDEEIFLDKFDSTSKAKKLNKEWDKYTDSDDEWYDVEQKYVQSKYQYAAEQLVKKYGAELTNFYASGELINDGKKAVSRLSSQWVYHVS